GAAGFFEPRSGPISLSRRGLLLNVNLERGRCYMALLPRIERDLHFGLAFTGIFQLLSGGVSPRSGKRQRMTHSGAKDPVRPIYTSPFFDQYHGAPRDQRLDVCGGGGLGGGLPQNQPPREGGLAGGGGRAGGVRRQPGQRIRTRELHGSRIARDPVAIRIEGSDGQTEGREGGHGGGSGQKELARRRRIDRDSLRAVDARHRVRDGQRLGAGCREG